MLKQLKKMREASDQKGFTIIEVLIVLAIAGLIMVVVFLAVPALQRSGRNNALNTDANNILTGVGNYISNNNGTLPATQTSAAPSGGVVTIGSSGNTETVKVDSGAAAFLINGTTITNASAVGTIQAITGQNAICNSTASGLGTAGSASTRAYVILYVAESGNGNIVKCIGG